MKNKLLFIVVVFIISNVYSQDKEVELDSIFFGAMIQSELGGKRMKLYGNTRFTLNQAYFSNWISGGESSVSGIFALDYNLNFSDRKGLVWDSNFLFSLGSTSVSGNKFVKKTDDRIEISSLVGSQINRLWSYSTYLIIKTQLLPGYNYLNESDELLKEKISKFLSPAIIQSGIGLYLKKDPVYWLNISPMAARVILVNKKFTKNLDLGQKYFGVDSNKTNKFFFGASFSGNVKIPLMHNVTMENKFNTYINYLEKTKNVDVEFNCDIRFKVNDKISSNLIIHFIYDDDLIKKLQTRELFGMGVNIDL
jgi:hypothetical protein